MWKQLPEDPGLFFSLFTYFYCDDDFESALDKSVRNTVSETPEYFRFPKSESKASVEVIGTGSLWVFLCAILNVLCVSAVRSIKPQRRRER